MTLNPNQFSRRSPYKSDQSFKKLDYDEYQGKTKGPRSSMREISGPEGHLANMRPFQGNSMSGERVGNEYHVKSYETVIHKADIHTGATLYHNSGKYSPTTAKHQSAAAAWTGRTVRGG